jgi:hypothetical protein
LSFFLFNCAAAEIKKVQSVVAPKTLESAVKIVISEMNQEDRVRLKNTSQEELHKIYRNWAEERYKKFLAESGGENIELFESSCTGDLCTDKNASMAIACGAWNSLNGKPIRKGVFACAVPALVIEPDSDIEKVK